MKTLTLVFLWFLGLFSNQVSTAVVSYATHYAELIVESSAIPNITGRLKSIDPMSNVPVNKGGVTLKYMNISTECKIDNAERNCTCNADYIWSGDLCSSHPGCCTMEYCITQTLNMTPMCIPKSRVTVTGTITVHNATVAELEKDLKKTLSELPGFDSLEITHTRKGSVIADFKMFVNNQFAPGVLAKKIKKIKNDLAANISVETKGLVRMEMPNMPVCFGSETKISCKFQDAVDSTWTLIQERTFEITTGTETNIAKEGQNHYLTIKKASAEWKGSYECSFVAENIEHKASEKLDIALLPEAVSIALEPQFQDCLGNKDTRSSKLTYKIKKDSENYIVHFNGTKLQPIGQGEKDVSADIITYEVKKKVNCRDENDEPVDLIFTNRKNQTFRVETRIHKIHKSPFCAADKEWPKAKNGFKATLPCSDGNNGHRERKCSSSGLWEDEISYCVQKDLYSLLHDARGILKGRGTIQRNAKELFSRLKNTTSYNDDIKTPANINASVDVLSVMSDASNSSNQSKPLDVSTLKDVLHSASNLLNESLNTSWIPKNTRETSCNLTSKYLKAVEGLSKQTGIDSDHDVLNYTNVEFSYCHTNVCNVKVFDVSISSYSAEGTLKTIRFKNLAGLLPNEKSNTEPSSIVMSAILEDQKKKSIGISLKFLLNKRRPRNHRVYCVSWHFSEQKWSEDGCVANLKTTNREDQVICECSHLSSFSTLMSKYPVHLPFLDELTYIGIGISIFSLIICLMTELIVWNSVVKTSIAHFRHMALVNISLCLLLADCCFLASKMGKKGNLCLIWALLQHFCYLSMFFWMLCLSIMLIHKLIFVFHQVRKKVYLAFSISLGYVCPAIIVFFSYIYYDSGERESYYSDNCWLIYKGNLEGSIHAFILPVGVIIFINLFSLVVVISKLLQPSVCEGDKGNEKDMAKSILKAVVFFTPIFGITWIFGFFTMISDLADGIVPMINHYLFTFFNAFQGIFILFTGCFGEKKVREALLIIFNAKSKSARSEPSSRFTNPKE